MELRGKKYEKFKKFKKYENLKKCIPSMLNQKQEKISNQSSKNIGIKLSKKLGPEYISYRTGFGNMQIAYLEGWAAISIANRIFGYDGWNSAVKSLTVDFIDELNGRYNIGVSAVVCVTLKCGSSREDIGFGSADNQRQKSLAIEKAKKEAVTDALKRALRQFGNALGNCCYDKEFLAEIKKIKKEKSPNLSELNLLRKSEVNTENLNFSFMDDDYDGLSQ